MVGASTYDLDRVVSLWKCSLRFEPRTFWIVLNSEGNITRVVRNLAFARKKGAISEHCLLIFLCLGQKGAGKKFRAQPWYARKSRKSPGQSMSLKRKAGNDYSFLEFYDLRSNICAWIFLRRFFEGWRPELLFEFRLTSEDEHPPEKFPKQNSSFEQVFLNNFCRAPNLCHREEGKSLCELFKRFLALWDFGWEFWPLLQIAGRSGKMTLSAA